VTGQIGSFTAEAAALDAADPLGWAGARYAPLPPDIVAYLDGNSLGRPLRSTPADLAAFAEAQWGGRLIRGWTDGWLEWPERVGDRLGTTVLGAAAGQVVVADSTSVLFYKLARAALDARPGRTRILVDTDNFPTDRWLLEGIAAERGATLDWMEVDTATGVSTAQVAASVGPDTALVALSHVAYRSGWVADATAVTAAAHDAGALMLWDCSHSAGALPVDLDGWDADLAVGCSYKYLGAGPGSPAWAYVARRLHGSIRQPVWGWIGHAEPFEMGPGYRPADSVRAILSGTPPILSMVPLSASLDVIAEAGIATIRAKSELLTDLVVRMADEVLVPLGVEVASPRDPDRRGGHVTLRREDFAAVNDRLWARGVIPDFRRPDGIRIGMSPLSTSFTEVVAGMVALAEEAGR
jgi:kynureninase